MGQIHDPFLFLEVKKTVVIVLKGKNPYLTTKRALQNFPLPNLKGKRVLIKPNAARLAFPGEGVTTHPQVVAATIDHLKEQGLLERTILVIVGDHGQAFGQHHPNNFMHYRYSYNENLETPAILYQPALFKPKAFGFPTSHVDLLPTLLDAMRIPYLPTAFDGASLFDNRSRQNPIFFYGYEGSISSLDSHLMKVQYSLKKKRCWAFDLKFDPDEKNPLDCSLYPLQVKALHQFVSDHDTSLLNYNAGLREKKGFSGTQAPLVKKVN